MVDANAVHEDSVDSLSVVEAKKSIIRIQEFNPDKLVQKERLGEQLSFPGVVKPASEIINLFKQIPLEHLHYLPENHLEVLKRNADAFFGQIEKILGFDPSNMQHPSNQRNSLIAEIVNSRTNYFDQTYHIISYLSGRVHDFAALQTEARGVIQSVKDETKQISSELENIRDDAQSILDEVRRVAAEQGVSQQAIYFANDSAEHTKAAAEWRSSLIWASLLFSVVAIGSLFLHKWSYLTPSNGYEAIQLAISKVLILSLVGYIIVLCSRNFLSHKHNAIVNKQRQNALMTFQALVDAAGEEGARDIVLTHAASCIFTPQETGYSKHTSSSSDAPALIGILQYLSRSGGNAGGSS